MNAFSVVVEGHDEVDADSVIGQAMSLVKKLNCPVKLVHRGVSLYIKQGDRHGDLLARLQIQIQEED